MATKKGQAPIMTEVKDMNVWTGRVSIALLLPQTCEWCGHTYTDVNDYLRGDPIMQIGGKIRCRICHIQPELMTKEAQ